MKEENVEQFRSELLVGEETRAMISTRAYEIYHQRGGEHGRDLEDWLQAENEVLAYLIEGGSLRAMPESEQLVTDRGETPAAKKSRTRAAPKSAAQVKEGHHEI